MPDLSIAFSFKRSCCPSSKPVSPAGPGILMVRKSMDAVDCRYEDGKNMLTIQKNIQTK